LFEVELWAGVRLTTAVGSTGAVTAGVVAVAVAVVGAVALCDAAVV
jgi:hypothetical protein